MNQFNRIMREKGFTQEELSKATGLSIGTLSNFANGKSELMYSNARKVAKVLGVPMEELVEED